MASLTQGRSPSRPFIRPRFFLVPPDRLGVSFPFSDLIVRRLKAVAGYRWEEKGNFWSFPRTWDTLHKLLAVFGTDWRILDRTVAEAFGFTKSTNPKIVPSAAPSTKSRDDLEAVRRELKIRNYSPRTLKTYMSCIESCARFFAGRPLRELSDVELRRYLLHQIEVNKVSTGTINEILNALHFLYVEVFKRPMSVKDIERPKKARPLPVVLSLEEVKRLLESAGNLKHRVLLMLAYSAGLRVSELVNLRLEDIDSDRELIHVRSGKGQKDRYTLLSRVVLTQLREYWKAFKPRTWLFEGQTAGEPYSVRSAQKVFQDLARKAGIRKKASIHSLRHSFATHLLEQGTDIRFIQELLGHSSVRTTEIYTHVSRRKLESLRSPIDQILQTEDN